MIEENNTTVAFHYVSRSRTLRLVDRSVCADVHTAHPETEARAYVIIGVQKLGRGSNNVKCITHCDPTTVVQSIAVNIIISK